ncbi:site-specific tyrosine recombinase XerD [Curtobacterium sp. MCSS17_015]|uniref:site-specific tyrosine recombinase XerD n=1 Tax=Curtobacterium sp. MCSS17_015 TaxID=2175666 RepID=UPI000DA8680F|nr:site-specific tyrosine recombinase XerD [Curtobacterium sp. MCSS17_015]WIB28065.1 site-specific tyrosine recombinase XerD [Curtobacterium sp. MCSS17_015]
MPFERATQDYLRHIAIERGLSQHTLSAYRRDLVTFGEWVGTQPVIDSAGADRAGGAAVLDDVGRLARADLAGFVQHLATKPEGPLAPRSVARMLSSVRSFSAFAAAEGWLPLDPGASVRPPKAPMRLPKAISVHDMERLLGAVVGDEPAQLRDRALLELLYATGARVSEAVGLSVDDVTTLAGIDDAADDTGDGTDVSVVRVTGKGNKQRIVPLGSYARAAVDAYLVRARPVFAARGPGTPALFLGARGARLSRQSAWLVIQAAAERAGLAAHVSPHTFRHSFATHLLEGGADVRVVQELLGHASVATTQIYTLVTADMLRDVYQTAHPRARR